MASTHVYGDLPDQFCELSLPEGEGPFPVAVVVHGGFWLAANGSLDRMRDLCASLVQQGWATWNVEYRRLGTGGGWPQSAQDVSAAIDHLAAIDAPLDLDFVVSIGHSAGGHLTLLDAARSPAKAGVRVAAAVGQAPLTDLQVGYASGAGSEIFEAFMGGTPDTAREAYAQASPVDRVPLGVPQLVVHGERDDLVPQAMATAYVAAARAAGDNVTFELRPNDGHFDHLNPETGAWAAVVAWLQAMHAEHLRSTAG